MHELSLLLGVVKTVERVAAGNSVTKIGEIVLQVGEMSSVVPHFLRAAYPAAVAGTILEGAELVIETIPASWRCRRCGLTFGGSEVECPGCGSAAIEIAGGGELVIKEIRVPDDESRAFDGAES